MKANFALTLSFTGIRLLHRAAGGWRFVGDVSLDDADLDGALAALRKTALELEPTGLRTKLVIPDTQIKYLTIDTDGVPDDALRDKAAVALQGATPYAVDELVFDLSPDGGKTHIAAVAHETLLEAEAFAVKHRFAPISVVAVPDGEAFLGEPFFGATDYASNLLGPGDRVEPDGIAVVELDAQEWPEGPVVDVADDTPVERAVPEPPATELQTATPEEPDLAQAHAEQESDARETAATLDARPPVEPEEMSDEVAGDADAADEEPSGVGFASRRRPGAGGAPKLGGVTRRFEPAPVQARGDAVDIATPENAATDEQKTPQASELALDDDVPNPPPSVLAAFLSRRQGQPTAEAPAARLSAPDAPSAPTPPKRVAPGKAEPAAAARSADDATPPSMDVAARKAPPEIRPVRVPRPKSERQRMTVFGARQPEPDGAATVGGKPRFLGLILTAMLLIFLAGVAAWAAAFMEDGLARFFGPREPEAIVTAEELAPEPEPESALSEPDVPAAPDAVETASLETELPPETSADVEPEMLVEPAEPPVFDPADAEAHYAVTGIWTIPPEVPEAPGVVDLDDLYMTSIDPANLSFDAVALTPEETVRNDHAPLAFANPAPAGTEFDLDDRGLVIPTPDGAMSPDGILIHAGQPPAVPPDTPDRAAEAPDDMDAAMVQKLSGYRPKSRPGDLVENTERQRLGGLSRSELAEYRPKLRPDTVKQAEEEDETPTARAVASSLRPSDRPGNFERIVARAERQNVQPETRDEAPEQTASVAPRTVAPAIPSRSSVAKEATVRNAINLRRINLMGVYGSPSNRRALVRLSNGRYKKVKVGDRIDGGRVSAIGDSELSYVKGNRSFVLTMPRT